MSVYLPICLSPCTKTNVHTGGLARWPTGTGFPHVHLSHRREAKMSVHLAVLQRLEQQLLVKLIISCYACQQAQQKAKHWLHAGCSSQRGPQHCPHQVTLEAAVDRARVPRITHTSFPTTNEKLVEMCYDCQHREKFPDRWSVDPLLGFLVFLLGSTVQSREGGRSSAVQWLTELSWARVDGCSSAGHDAI